MMVVLTVAAACSDGEAQVGVPSATVGTEAPTTTTTNPYAVPAVIDAAYVNRVLGGLDKAYGDVVRLVVSSGGLVIQASNQLRAIYSANDWLQLEFDRFQEETRTRFRHYKSPPGNQETVVDQLIVGNQNCIFVRVRRDYSAMSEAPSAPGVEWVGLVPLDPSRDPNGFNVTGWAYAYNGFPPPGSPAPSSPCA